MPSVFKQAEPLLELERQFRTALLSAGVQVFGQLLQHRIDQIDGNYQAKLHQERMGRRSLTVATLFGEVLVHRDYYYDGQQGYCPADAALGLEGHFTPALARLICRAAAEQPYGAASRDLQEYGGIDVEQRQIQRVVLRIAPDTEEWLEKLVSKAPVVPTLYVSCDGTGAPMRKEELVGRKGKQPDAQAKTREVKLGAVFTQHTRDEKGRPVRDHQSTTYVGSFDQSADFALLLRQEAQRRGVALAKEVIFLSDGAIWTEELQRQNFPEAVSILDLYHPAHRLHTLAQAVTNGPEATAKQQAGRWIKLLLKDQVAKVIQQARKLLPNDPERRQAAEEEINFLKSHKHRMLYGTYRKKGWFIGSGVIEAGCKTVVGKRLKQSGMFWSEPGATCVLNFRTLLLSYRFDAFWRDRQNHAAARNDTLALDA